MSIRRALGSLVIGGSLAVGLGGCGMHSDEMLPADMSVADLTAAPSCIRDCPGGCPAGQICIEPSALSGFTGFCATPCSTTSDCTDPDDRCIQILTETLPRMCASWETPEACPGATWSSGCYPPAAACADANTLTAPVAWPDNNICGTEHVACPNGCVTGPVDGGAIEAHCI